MGVVNIAKDELCVRLDANSHVALPFKRDKKRVDFIAFDGEGPQHMFCSVPDFDRTYTKVYEKPLEDSVLSFLRGSKRAYLPGDGIADVLLEIFNMVTIDGKPLGECSIKQLVAYYNKLHKAAGNSGEITEKTFKSKGLLMEAIDAMASHAVSITPEQAENKQTVKEAATKRLSGLKKDEPAAEEEIPDLPSRPPAEPAAKSKIGKAAAAAAPAKGKKAPEPPAKPIAKGKKAEPAKPAAKGKAAPAPAKKAGKAEEKKPRGQGIGAFCMDLILKKKSNEDVLAAVAKQFPGASTSNSCVAWYRNKLKNEGKL